MAAKVKIPVFFIATKTKNEPVEVSFFTKKGQTVASDMVKKIKTKEGVRFYVETPKSKRR